MGGLLLVAGVGGCHRVALYAKTLGGEHVKDASTRRSLTRDAQEVWHGQNQTEKLSQKGQFNPLSL
jgi:hypothetical protein